MSNELQGLIVRLVDTLKLNGFYGGLKMGDGLLATMQKVCKEANRPTPIAVHIWLRASHHNKLLGGRHSVHLHHSDGQEAPPLAWDPHNDTPDIKAEKLRTTLTVLGEWLGKETGRGKTPTRATATPPLSPPSEDDWLAPPTSLRQMAERLDTTPKHVKTILKPYGLKQAGSRQSWTVCLTNLPANYRRKLER
jgi:hypothetical protein